MKDQFSAGAHFSGLCYALWVPAIVFWTGRLAAWRRCRAGAVALVAAIGMASGSVARAQVLDSYFPPPGVGAGGIPADNSRQRAASEFAPLGIQLGDFSISPRLNESFGYDSNVDFLGLGGSPLIETSGSVVARSGWLRDSLSAELTFDNRRYPSQSAADTTTWTGSIGGTLDIGRDTLGATYNHLNLIELPHDIGSNVVQPVPFQVDIVSASYLVATGGKFSFLPNFGVTRYNFGTGSGETFNNRTVTQESLVTRYQFFPGNDGLVVLSGTQIRYDQAVPGVPLENSDGARILVGLDYDNESLIRYRALLGYQVRAYQSSLYKTQTAPILEASVIWVPTSVDTLTLSLLRDIEDTSAEGLIAYTYTTGRLEIDHEYRRNILLKAYVQGQRADYQANSIVSNGGTSSTAGQSQTIYSIGASATWQFNRSISLTAGANFLSIRGSATGITGVSGGSNGSLSEGVAIITLGFAL